MMNTKERERSVRGSGKLLLKAKELQDRGAGRELVDMRDGGEAHVLVELEGSNDAGHPVMVLDSCPAPRCQKLRIRSTSTLQARDGMDHSHCGQLGATASNGRAGNRSDGKAIHHHPRVSWCCLIRASAGLELNQQLSILRKPTSFQAALAPLLGTPVTDRTYHDLHPAAGTPYRVIG